MTAPCTPAEITVEGVTYVPKDAATPAKNADGLPYMLIRSAQAGVFAGYVVSREGKEVTLTNARRIWYWDGAASLSQLATDGPSKPKTCKFAVPVDVIVTEACEILTVTEKARKVIEGVTAWVS